MDEARRVLARLERIEALDREQALPGALLAELRALLSEAEAWTRAEHAVPDTAVEAVEHCRLLLKDRPATAQSATGLILEGTSRTLLA